MVDIKEVAEFLKAHNFYRILCHQNPDGDTIGSAFALKRMLEMLGKTANVSCSDVFPMQYGYMTNVPNNPDADYETLVSVDIADTQLFGKKFAPEPPFKNFLKWGAGRTPASMTGIHSLKYG